MLERRSEARTPLNVAGRISLDEHRALPCIVFDRSPDGVRVALPDVELDPDMFVLTVDGTGEVLVCRAAWRRVDVIGCIAGSPDSTPVLRSSRRRPALV